MAQYIAVIRKAEGTDYWIDCPDIPGCYSGGETIDAAKAKFKDALAFHLEAMREDKLALREPRAKLSDDDLEDSVQTYLIEV